ncbi:hypothetical protein ACET3Z_019574 [Daucus carota]
MQLCFCIISDLGCLKKVTSQIRSGRELCQVDIRVQRQCWVKSKQRRQLCPTSLKQKLKEEVMNTENQKINLFSASRASSGMEVLFGMLGLVVLLTK